VTFPGLRALAAGRPGDTVLPVLLGLAATLGFAPFNGYFLIPFVLAGLLALVADQPARRAALRAWLFGFAHFGSGVYWVFISIARYGGGPVWVAFPLVVVLAAYLALYPAAVGFALGRLRYAHRAVWALVAFPSAWTLAELVRGWVMSGFPWLSIGYAAIDSPLRGLAPLTGVFGLGTVIATLSGALWLAASTAGRERWMACAAMAATVALALLVPPPLSWTTTAGKSESVALVQGNIPQNIKWDPEIRQLTLDRYRDMTEPLWGTRLIIWPEVALPTLRSEVEDYLIELQQTAVEKGSTLLLGVITRDGDRSAPVYNSVVEIGADTGAYYKRHLVPFGEYFPVPGFLLDVGKLLGMRYSNFSFGPPDQELLQVGGIKLGISICFEDAFGDELRRELPEAGLLVNMTNDAWFDVSTGPSQHLQIARMRALEMGRPLLRVANTGVSGVIDADGVLQEEIGARKTGSVSTIVQPRSGLTPYARYGDRPVWWIALFLLSLSAFFALKSHGRTVPA
jgi:apolipoprotein N-acyltransferase